jgi:hypothetical protein
MPDAGIRTNLLLQRRDDNIELNRRTRPVSYIGGVANGVGYIPGESSDVGGNAGLINQKSGVRVLPAPLALESEKLGHLRGFFLF